MRAHLFQQTALLDDVRYRLHLHTLGLVDVLECVELACLLVLDDPDLYVTLRRSLRSLHLREVT